MIVAFQTRNPLPSEQIYSTQRWSLLCAVMCVYIHVLWDHSLCKLWGETTTDCTHWNPQTPVLHPSISPSLSLFCLPPCRAPRGATLEPNASIHLPAPLHPPPASFHPSPSSHDLPITYRSFVLVGHSPASFTAQLEYFPIRHRLFDTSFIHACEDRVQTIIPPDTSCTYLPPSSRAKPPTHAYFPLMQVQLLYSPPGSKPQTTGL